MIFFQKRGPRGPKNDFFEKYAQVLKGLKKNHITHLSHPLEEFSQKAKILRVFSQKGAPGGQNMIFFKRKNFKFEKSLKKHVPLSHY